MVRLIVGRDFASENEASETAAPEEMSVQGGEIEFPFKYYLNAPKKYKTQFKNVTRQQQGLYYRTLNCLVSHSVVCLFVFCMTTCCGR